MKKINALLILPLLFICSSTIICAETIKSEQEVEGSWLLEYTKKSPQEGKKEMGITWVLKDHKLTQKDIPQSRGNPYDSAPVDYTIENGNLKVGVPGRVGKFDEYSLVEKTDTTMVLKDPKFGTYFYFTKK
ncbi:MAG: hypothetical protein LUO95_00160 [Methylococcaceae bacterium]|nr:hypothetical protein [Methylococcaceae bacterium]